MDLLEFLVLSAVNLGLVVFVIRKWSLVSAEGFCMAYLGAAILTDNIELLFHYIFSPQALHLGYGEFNFRIYPTAIHILGLCILIVGLAAINPRPVAIRRQLDRNRSLELRSLGIAIAVVGLILATVAIYLVGALSAPNFYSAINGFRSQTVPFGGFWYRGADVIVFGLALTLPSTRNHAVRFFSVLSVMMLVSFFLRTNKGGLEEPILWAAIVIYVYDHTFFKSLCGARNIALACLIAFFGMGAKLWFLPLAYHRTGNASTTVAKLADLASSTAATRWGDDSLYRGYCQFVNSLPDNRRLFSGYKVGRYILTSWVPRVLYPNKPAHPFRGLGFMIYSDFHTFPSETPAPTLMGSVMADNGVFSLAIYIFLAGMFLSIFRSIAAGPRNSIHSHAGYLLFVLFGGFSAEEGILGLLYTLFLAYGVMGVAYLVASVWRLSNARSIVSPAVCSVPDGVENH